jgi:23S rRNA (uracil1939-C5)-methyltransferase
LDFLCMNVKKALQARSRKILRPDVIVLDPPRPGCDQIIRGVVELGASRIIYISCDPGTLARDLSMFRSGGYLPLRTRPVDMFPHTYHIESVTLLRRISQGA